MCTLIQKLLEFCHLSAQPLWFTVAGVVIDQVRTDIEAYYVLQHSIFRSLWGPVARPADCARPAVAGVVLVFKMVLILTCAVLLVVDCVCLAFLQCARASTWPMHGERWAPETALCQPCALAVCSHFDGSKAAGISSHSYHQHLLYCLLLSHAHEHVIRAGAAHSSIRTPKQGSCMTAL